MRSSFLRISLALFLFIACLDAQVLRETRAVWISTNFRLDWPPKSNDSQVQKNALIKILDDLKRNNFNTVYFQVRSNGTLLYNSEIEPFAIHLVPQRDFDPLQFAIEESHKRGLEIHAWVNVVRLFSGSETSILRNPNHLKNKFPYWVKEFVENGSVSYWLDMGYPEVRNYLTDLFNEIIQKYNVDGLHLDFIRYPGRNFNDSESYKLYGNGIDKDDWRRMNINSFISDLYNSIKKINPLIKLGAAPIGIYQNIGGLRGFEGYNDVYQDSRYWLKTGIIDYIVPQIYWSFGGSVPFEKIADDWLKNKYGRQVILGLAPYKPDVKLQLNKMIQYSRDNNADGVSFFRYENIANTSFPLFNEKALPVEYPWIKQAEPTAPQNLAYNFIDNSIHLSWRNPANTTSIFYYGLYNENNLLELFENNVSSVRLRSSSNKFVMDLYLRSIDKAWNESKERSNIITVRNPTLNSFYSMIIDDEANPVLLKLNNQFYISLISSKEDQIVISQNDSKLTEHKIHKGKNIISLNDRLKNPSNLTINFTNSGKSIRLSK